MKDGTEERIDKSVDESIENKDEFEMTMSKLNDATIPEHKQSQTPHSGQLEIKGKAPHYNAIWKLY